MRTGRKLLETTTHPSLQNGIYLETDIKIQNICINKQVEEKPKFQV